MRKFTGGAIPVDSMDIGGYAKWLDIRGCLLVILLGTYMYLLSGYFHGYNCWDTQPDYPSYRSNIPTYSLSTVKHCSSQYLDMKRM